MTLRITIIPGDRNDQYRRNFLRASGSVVLARVSVRNTDSLFQLGSARSVHTIFTYPGSWNASNSSGGKARKTGFASHGFVTPPITISRPGNSARTPHPSDFTSARSPRGWTLLSGLLRRINYLPLHIPGTTAQLSRSISVAADNATSAG